MYGHSLTYYRNADREEFFILIGGDSPQYGFLNTVWEYAIEKNVWRPVSTKGNGPPGIFGHSTVFHSQTNSLYVFGGYVYDKQVSVMSNSLYRLEYETKSWIELSGNNFRNVVSKKLSFIILRNSCQVFISAQTEIFPFGSDYGPLYARVGRQDLSLEHHGRSVCVFVQLQSVDQLDDSM